MLQSRHTNSSGSCSFRAARWSEGKPTASASLSLEQGRALSISLHGPIKCMPCAAPAEEGDLDLHSFLKKDAKKKKKKAHAPAPAPGHGHKHKKNETTPEHKGKKADASTPAVAAVGEGKPLCDAVQLIDMHLPNSALQAASSLRQVKCAAHPPAVCDFDSCTRAMRDVL